MQRKQCLNFLFIALMLVSAGCTSVTPAPGTQVIPSSEPPANMPEPAAQNSSQALDNVAGMIYDAAATGQNLNSYIIGVMTAFDVPPLGENDLDLAKERYSQGLPLMFLPQVPIMADAFLNGSYVSLDSFIAAVNEKGATQQRGNEPLTREYLTQRFGNYTGKSQYEPGQVLPAFVLALARVRADRFPSNDPDPLWGDGLLDPLQFTLLLYGVSYSGSNRTSSQAPVMAVAIPQNLEMSFAKGVYRGALAGDLARSAMSGGKDLIVDFIKDQVEGEIIGEVQEMVELPLDQQEAAKISVCASLLLFGHKMEVTNTPNLIYHKDGEKPWATQVNVTLTFQDDYYKSTEVSMLARWMIEDFTDCKLPPPGPVTGKPLWFSVSAGLIGHGDFDMGNEGGLDKPSLQTDSHGKAFASWKTVPETSPKSQRTFYNQRDAVGAIIVRAGGLVSDFSTLELIVNHLRDTGGVGNAPLTVIYYVSPGYKVTGQYDGFTFSGVICDLEKPFKMKAVGPMWESNFEFTPANSMSGTFTVTGAFSAGGITTTAEGTYTVSPANDGTYQLILESPSGTYNTEWGSTGDMPGGSAPVTLTPLDTKECAGK